MYASKPNIDLVRIVRLFPSHRISSKPGTFNIYLFESHRPQGEKCLQVHELAENNQFDFPASQGYHISLREELILMLGCGHIAPFDLCEARGSHLILESAPASFAKLAAIIEKVPRDCDLDNSGLKARMLSLVKLLTIQVARHHRKFQHLAPAGLLPFEDLTARFVKLINLEIYQRRAICEYARLLSVSRGILDQALQTTTGYTANRLIQKTLVYKAKQAAISSCAPMKETAYNLGFNDMAHFSKFFRQNAGMTFSTFKQIFQNG